MEIDAFKLKIVLIVTVGFGLASILGYISQRLKLSPLLGYLLAGYIIGPYSPGFVADAEISEQLAEIGVILMMFGVGMHFKWEDLAKVKYIAIPGAVGQTLAATVISAILIHQIGWSLESGIVIGLAIGVASTVVLIRVLSDYNVLHSPQGHVAVGWLIVEDILTVIALILLPTLALSLQGGSITYWGIGSSILIAMGKFVLLTLLMFTVGRSCVKYILFHIARMRSQELFTVTVLALTFLIATGSALLFGASIALGAFIAGMVIGQTDVRHQASANALPLKDAFVVIFFLSVGMLFNPPEILNHFPLFLIILAVVLLVKPVAAFLLVKIMRYPLKTALTVAIALAQIGEFSFILSEEAMKLKLLPDEGYDIIVACALISIAINPLLFGLVDSLSQYFHKKESEAAEETNLVQTELPGAIIVGFGPIGKKMAHILESAGFSPTIIDSNVDTITALTEQGKHALYGDASVPNILEIAHVENAYLLVITVPEIDSTISMIHSARQLHPKIPIFARCSFISDSVQLEELEVTVICSEAESLKAFETEVINTIDHIRN